MACLVEALPFPLHTIRYVGRPADHPATWGVARIKLSRAERRSPHPVATVRATGSGPAWDRSRDCKLLSAHNP